MKPWRPWENSAKFPGLHQPWKKAKDSPKLHQPWRNKRTLTKTQKTASYYEFKASSTLKAYLSKRDPDCHYPRILEDILKRICIILEEEGQFDKRNPSIIICNPDLEQALNMKALHVSELEPIVVSHLIKQSPFQQRFIDSIQTRVMRGPLHKKLQYDQKKVQETSHLACPPVDHLLRKVKPSPYVYEFPLTKFSLSHEYRKVVSTLKNFNQRRTTFSMREAVCLLRDYILANHERLIDNRNIKIVICDKDPLGAAFKVDAFHNSQAIPLLKKCLIHPAYPNMRSGDP